MENFKKICNEQLEWLSKSIFSNGEFVMHNSPTNGKYKIVPYFSNISGLALVNHEKYLSIIKKYLQWYFDNINIPDKFGVIGTIYDYNLNIEGVLESTNDYDSYDSYPATFLTLCMEYFKITNNKEIFWLNKEKLDYIVSSLVISIDKDYLSFAKPNYKIKYLMDNCEVYRGLIDGSYIYYQIYSDMIMYNTLKDLAKNNYNSIQNKMYSSKENTYYCAIDKLGIKNKLNLNKWYPDAVSQLFPILYGVIDINSTEAKDIYNIFNQHQPNWYNENNTSDFPNAYVGYIGSLMKDHEKVNDFIKHCINKYINNENKWPWNTFECSYFIRILEKY